MTTYYRPIIAPLLALSMFTAGVAVAESPSPGAALPPAAIKPVGAKTAGNAVVARIARLPITVADVRRAMVASSVEALKDALQQTVNERLLAMQAKVVVGATSARMTMAQKATAVRQALFAPGRLCRNIPLPMRRQHYDETRWRFWAPPAWTVVDLQWLCCQNPRECKTPAATACIAKQETQLGDFQAAVDDAMAPNPKAPLAKIREGVTDFGDVFAKSYTFYFDPETPDAKVGWRLQEVDRPIAVAAAKLAVGDTSKVLKSRFGHHVLRLLHRRPGIKAAFDDPRTQAILATELCPKLLIQQEERTLADLELQTPMKVFSDVLKAAFGPLWSSASQTP